MTAKPEKATPERESIEKIRNDKNPLEIRANSKWPNMYEIIRSNGGNIPRELNGQYTSHAMAKSAVARHLG